MGAQLLPSLRSVAQTAVMTQFVEICQLLTDGHQFTLQNLDQLVFICLICTQTQMSPEDLGT